MSDDRDSTLPVVELDRLAVVQSARLVAAAQPEDWHRPTPCSEWDLDALVAHMTVQHHGFAAAAEGAGPDLADWTPTRANDPKSAYAAAAERVTAAFAAPAVLEREFWLPEFSTTVPFPGERAIGFHFLDYVVHAWDVARTIGAVVELDDEVVESALAIAVVVPDDERRLRPGAAFGPALPRPGQAEPWDQLLAHLGRSPLL